jgi:hypothetical protein
MMNIYKLNSVNVAIGNTFLLFAIALFIFSVFEPFAYGGESSDKVEKVQISEITQSRFFGSNIKLSHKWKHDGFDDSIWRVDPNDLDPAPKDNLYSRQMFKVNNPESVTQMSLTVVCNAPFVAYLNGIEVARSKKGTTERINFIGFADEIVIGNNIFAIELNEIDGSKKNLIPSLEIGERGE